MRRSRSEEAIARRYIKMLQKRANHLSDRITTGERNGRDLSFDKEEHAALRWALNQLQPGVVKSQTEERRKSYLKCPHCGEAFQQLRKDASNNTPTHNYPLPCRSVCPGSGQPLIPLEASRLLGKDVGT